MSTRCAIVFEGADGRYPVAVYKHSDGYPDGQQWLAQFAKAFHEGRGDDPEYAVAQCAAQIVLEHAEARKTWGHVKPEDYGKREYLGVGVFALAGREPDGIHGDLDYVWKIDLLKGAVYWRRASKRVWTRLLLKEAVHA